MLNATPEKKSFDDVNRDAKKLKDDTSSYLQSDPSDALDRAKGKAREAGKNVYDFFKSNSGKLKKAEESASRTISSNPLASAAAIFAAGLVLGSALKRSRKNNNA